MEENKEKILVLSCGTGGGHNSAGKAIAEAFQKRGIWCDFKEYLDIINPKVKNCVNSLYIRSTIGKGKIFKVTYHLGELYQRTKIKSPVYGLNSLSRRKLQQYIVENHYQYVITTHLFAAQALTTIKRKYPIHFLAVATDYVSIPFWEETNPDYFVIPNEELKESFCKRGIPEEKLLPFGIPVSLQVREKIDVKKQKEELGLAPEKRHILVATGSMGFGKNEEMVQGLLTHKKPEDILIVACGSNEKMKQELEAKFAGRKDFVLLSYTNELIRYMQIADVILTKPGGLTTTEVAAMRKPLVHTMPIPGCENFNAEYFAQKGMSLKSENAEEVWQNTIRLLEDKDLQEKMLENQRKVINPQASEKIVDFVQKEIKEFELA